MTSQITQRAKYVATVSHTIKDELVATYGIDQERISVIYNGVYFRNELTQKPHGTGQLQEKQFALFVGGHDPRKRLHQVLDHWDRVDFPLVATIRKNTVFHSNPGRSQQHVYLIDDVDDSQLRWLYQNAFVLIYPSAYEGFGLPILEAQSFNCPCIASDLPVFREIYGDSVLYIDNLDQIPHKLQQLQNNEQLRYSLVQAGKKNVKNYQYLRFAEKIQTLLTSA